MIAVLLVLLPFLFIMFSQGDEIRKLQKKLYEKEQENKGLRVRLGDPFRNQVAEEIAFGKDDHAEKFSVMIDALEEDGDES